MVRWSFFWIIIVSGISGLIDWLVDLDLLTWQLQLRYFAAFTFLLAILAGSFFTLNRKRFYHKEWSFILLMITLGLFGISVI